MFYSLHLVEFGKKITSTRKNNKLTRSLVSQETGVNIDTIRRIEKGLVLPKLDTLIILSSAYKADLLKIFMNKCSDEYLISIYNQIDSILENENTDKIIEFCNESIESIESIEGLKSKELLFLEIERKQLVYLLKGIKYSTNIEQLKESTKFLIEGIKCTNPDICSNKLDKLCLTEIEIRLLYLIAANYLDEYKIEESIKILTYILSIKDNELSDKTKIRAYALLAYNLFLKGRYEESLISSEKGLEIARTLRTTYYVHALLARKAVALKKLNRDGFEYNMRICLSILEFEDNKNLIAHYRKISKESYGVDL